MRYRKKPVAIEAYHTDQPMDIETLEGTMHASPGDYIITGVNGEQYPCKPGIFKRHMKQLDKPRGHRGVFSCQKKEKTV